MGREDPQVRVRLDIELKSMLIAAAEANSRSFNAEVIARLAASFVCDPADPRSAMPVKGHCSQPQYDPMLSTLLSELRALSDHLGVKKSKHRHPINEETE